MKKFLPLFVIFSTTENKPEVVPLKNISFYYEICIPIFNLKYELYIKLIWIIDIWKKLWRNRGPVLYVLRKIWKNKSVISHHQALIPKDEG